MSLLHFVITNIKGDIPSPAAEDPWAAASGAPWSPCSGAGHARQPPAAAALLTQHGNPRDLLRAKGALQVDSAKRSATASQPHFYFLVPPSLHIAPYKQTFS